jgi:hypothetical protein
MTVTDWVQAGRYAAGLDPLTPAGGPATQSLSLPVRQRSAQPVGQSRFLRAANATLVRGHSGEIFIELLGLGDENAIGFSINFDPGQLAYVAAEAGVAASGTTLNVNTNQITSGRLGFALALLPGGVFPPGTNQIIRITLLSGASGLTTNSILAFGDTPVVREISSITATVLPAEDENGIVTLLPPPPLFSSFSLLGGQFQMTLTGNSGEIYDIEVSSNLAVWVPLLSLTNTTGTITFTEIAPTNPTQRYYRSRVR